MKPPCFQNTAGLASFATAKASAKLNTIKIKPGAWGSHHPAKINFDLMIALKHK